MNANDSTALFAFNGERFLPLLYLAAALVVGAVVIVLVNRWRKSGKQLGPSPSDELAQYRALYEQGALSEEEYKKLRALLGGEIRKSLAVPGKLPAPELAPPPPPASDEPPPTGIKPT